MKEKEGKGKRDIWQELELGLGGGRKFRILVCLALNPNKAFTKYALTKATGLRTLSIEKWLKTLMELGWVKENEFKPKIYQINPENEVVIALLDFFQRLRTYFMV
ncbi:MAG: hypothetical protein QXU95_03640 [Candidatus Bathyarchaeia archaeon]